MASKENIYVESDFDNIFIINPNKIVNDDGTVDDRNIKQEDLVIYANLECNLQPRSRLLVGEDSQNLETIQIASVNFLKPGNKDYLTTEWTNFQTGSTRNNRNINSELLGIKNITYKITPSFVPEITIILEDIRGRALFESGNDSIYSVFFNLPYPTFYLTMKGYYGKAVRYPIILQKFHASFDQSSGNFIITLNFLGYKFNVLTDVTQSYVMATPQMYTKRYISSQQNSDTLSNVDASVSTINNNNTQVESIVTQEGYEKIKEVYKIYKQKGLISEDFPELTIQQLITKLENFETDVLNNIGQISVDDLTNVKSYDTLLEEFKKDVYTSKSPLSWFNKYMDTKNFFIYVDLNGKEYTAYTYKKDLSEYSSYVKELDKLIEEKNLKLDEVPTFGKNGKENKIQKKVKSNNIYKVPNIQVEDLINNDVSITKTAISRFGTQSPSSSQKETIRLELSKIREQNDKENEKAQNNQPFTNQFFFIFEGEDFFINVINEIKKELETKKNKIESELTDELIELLKSSEGIGFLPTIRNVVAVIMASTDAFLRLMDEVHRKAFDSRDNPIKKISVINDIVNNESPVYPWPQYAKEIDIDGCQKKYEIKYPGDPDYISETGANNYQIWPEVEFVEEFIKGFLQRQIPPVEPNDEDNQLTVINRLLFSAFDTPSNSPYSNLQIIPFLYEIWERIEYVTDLQGFVRNEAYNDILNFIQSYEASNIIKGIGKNAPKLSELLKNSGFNYETYYEYLRSVSNGGVGEYFQKLIRGIINTPYLKSEIENSTKIFNSDLPTVNTSVITENDSNKVETSIENYLKSSRTNEIYFTDTYPFISKIWREKNLPNSSFYSNYTNYNNTSSTLFFNRFTKKISNYVDDRIINSNGNNSTNRPFTTFQFLQNKITFPVVEYDYNSFYENRLPKDFNLTEGYVQYDDYNGLVGNNQTTSILNTPFFVKSIQIGVQKERDGIVSPYTEAAFLFLNSLPLSTTKESFISYVNSFDKSEGLISPAIKKFGTVNSLPKLWIYKIGSIWYRYKTYVNSGVDILDDSLSNIDFYYNFEPNNSDPYFTYQLSANNQTYNINLLSNFLLPNGSPVDSMNIGFYPVILNDFYRFYNGIDLYRSNETILQDIQQSLDNGELVLINNSESGIVTPEGVTSDGVSYNSNVINNFSFLFKNKLPNQSNSESYFTAPSFGTNQNQTQNECFNSNGLQIPLFNNESIFNGSIRVNWGLPNFGYFDSSNVTYCSYDKYPKNISTGNTIQNPFSILNNIEEYTSIEELFTIFTKDELDLFENEFLEFSKSSNESTNTSNFQTIIRNSIKGNFNIFGNPSNVIEGVQSLQNITFNQSIITYLNQNFLLQKGNPTNFKKQIFRYFSTNRSSSFLTNINSYNSTTPNALPTQTNLITLEDSILNYENEWKTLRTYVGFSTIDELKYLNTGSYITDFFIDNDIAFTSENIILFSEIIKLYASRKLINQDDLSDFNFAIEINTYLNSLNELQEITFEGVMTKIQKSLPIYDVQSDTVNDSKTQGLLTKVEYYEIFKTINDKWIAGNNYNSETLYEDFLFLDRANRNIGDLVITDVFKVKNYLKTNPTANIYTIISSIIRDHNFVIFSIPSYVNFYNVQTPGDNPERENEFEFANKIFGQFTEVDYQSSRPKIVCVYSEKPSEQLNNPGRFNGYKDDSFNMNRTTDNPLIECQIAKEEKDDFGLSNKVVGFSVDFGLQNQGVFENVQVSQDLGKATSESLQMEYDLANLSKGTNTSTQNVSLYNIYKNRSYKATVTSFGNAIIQPTMYFVLRNIPLFSGPYLIDEVSHVITNGSFRTTFTGTRQRIYTLPLQNQLLEVIRKDFITKLISEAVNKKEVNKTLNSNVISEKNEISNNISSELAISPNQTCIPITDYNTYENIQPTQYNTDFKTIRDIIVNTLSSKSDSTNMNKVIFTLFYISTSTPSGFIYYNFNLASIPLGGNISKWGGDLSKYFENKFSCLTGSDNQSLSYAVFPTVGNCVNFCYDKYKDYFTKGITDFDNLEIFVEGFIKTWIERFPQDRTGETPTIYNDFKSSNSTQFEFLQRKVTDCYNIMNSLGI